jgi:hypothetical protein
VAGAVHDHGDAAASAALDDFAAALVRD